MDTLIITRMQTLVEGWEAANDRRAVFLGCYLLMTRNMEAALQRGEFEDSAWVSMLLQRFASYYFEALDAYEAQTGRVCDPWRIAFETAREPDTHLLQHLILGVNAHINYDLMFALADTLRTEWNALSPEMRESRYRDHCHVNEIIAQTTDSVQDGILERYQPSLNLLDAVTGPLDEWMISTLITHWRQQIWELALEMVNAGDGLAASHVYDRAEQRSINRARAILAEGGILGFKDLL